MIKGYITALINTYTRQLKEIESSKPIYNTKPLEAFIKDLKDLLQYCNDNTNIDAAMQVISEELENKNKHIAHLENVVDCLSKELNAEKSVNKILANTLEKTNCSNNEEAKEMTDTEKIPSEIHCKCGSSNIEEGVINGSVMTIKCKDCGYTFDYDFLNKVSEKDKEMTEGEKILSEIRCRCGSANINDIDANGPDMVTIECKDCGDIFDYDFKEKKIYDIP